MLLQLHELQEELERSYLRIQSIENDLSAELPKDVSPPVRWVDDELPDILAENQRLRALVEAQKKVHQLQSQNALNARLGDILIQGIEGPVSLLAVPVKIGKMWLGSARRTPPKSLGGKDFDKVITAYRDGGFPAVEKLMNETSVVPAIRADGYKALATHLGESESVNTAEAARRAYALSPTRLRLKWLIFRLQDAGDVVEAEAMLDLLPRDTPLNQSDRLRVSRLRNEAEQVRQREARRKSKFTERRAEFERRFNNLTANLEAKSKLAKERDRDIRVLRLERAELAKERDLQIAALQQEKAELGKERDRQVAALRQEKAELTRERDLQIAALQQEKTELGEERDRQVAALRRERAELTKERDLQIAALQQEKAELAEERDLQIAALQQEKAGLAEERDLQIAALEQEKAELAEERDLQIAALQQENAGLAEERDLQIAALRQENAGLAEERDLQIAALLKEKAELAEERDLQVKAFQQEKTELAKERDLQITALLKEKAELAEERDLQVAALKQEKTELAEERDLQVAAFLKEKAELAKERDLQIKALVKEKAELAEERDLQITALLKEKAELAEERDLQIAALEQEKTELAEELDLRVAAFLKEKAELSKERDLQIAALVKEKAELAKERDLQIAAFLKEKAELAKERDLQIAALVKEKAELAKERDLQIAAFRQEKAGLEKENSILRRRNQISFSGKVNKGNTDIDDLIADMEHFFYGRAIVYVDVGAYVGDVFLKIKQTAKKFRIHEAHLYEPNPVSYTQLSTKVSAKDGPIVHTYNLAISDSSEDKLFIKARTMTKALSLADAQTENSLSDTFTASCVSLDDHSSVFTEGAINFLKIDVEGKELDVLAGARQLLANQAVDILYIEVGFNSAGTQQTYFPNIDMFLQPLGYRVLRIYEQKEEWMSGSPVLRRANVAYMSDKFAKAHPVKLMQELQELRDKVEELTGK